jgi:hypothetical protein
MANVWEHSQHKGSALLLMLAIADFAKDDGTGAWPSVETLAAKMRMTSRNTQLLLRKLEASGELRIDPGAGPHGTHLYAVVIAGGEKISGVKNPVKGGEKMSSGGVKATSPNPLKKPSNKPSDGNTPPAQENDNGILKALRHINTTKLEEKQRIAPAQLKELALLLAEQGQDYNSIGRLWLSCADGQNPVALFISAVKKNGGEPYPVTRKEAATVEFKRPGWQWVEGTGWSFDDSSSYWKTEAGKADPYWNTSEGRERRLRIGEAI